MSEQQSSAESAQDFPGLVQDLPLIWQGWCNAIRLMEDKATVRRPENAAQAAAYEQCAKDLKEALTRPARTEPQSTPATDANRGEALRGAELGRWCYEHPNLAARTIEALRSQSQAEIAK